MPVAANPAQQLSQLLEPWYASIKDPDVFQEGVLQKLLH